LKAHPNIHRTIESEDRNTFLDSRNIAIFENHEISRIDEELIHEDEEPREETRDDLQGLLKIMNEV